MNQNKRAAATLERELSWTLKKLPDNLSSGQDIVQALLKKEEDVSIRIRKTTDRITGHSNFTMTTKIGKGEVRREHSCQIDEICFSILMKYAEEKYIQKKVRRYRGRWVVDQIIEGREEGSIFVEYELDPTEQVPPSLPEDFDIVKDADE